MDYRPKCKTERYKILTRKNKKKSIMTTGFGYDTKSIDNKRKNRYIILHSKLKMFVY